MPVLDVCPPQHAAAILAIHYSYPPLRILTARYSMLPSTPFIPVTHKSSFLGPFQSILLFFIQFSGFVVSCCIYFFICTHLNLCLDRYSSSMLNKSYSGNTHTFFQDHPVLTESTNGNPNNCSQGCLETLYKHKPLKDCKFLWGKGAAYVSVG